jgi:hypothetical protein
MIRLAICVLAVVLLGACASDGFRYNIDYESLSSRLYVEGSDGEVVEPLSGHLVDIDGLGIGPDAIRIVPGTYWIRTQCPPAPSGVQWTHGPPSIEHTFEIGKAYILSCEDGYPVIRLRE